MFLRDSSRSCVVTPSIVRSSASITCNHRREARVLRALVRRTSRTFPRPCDRRIVLVDGTHEQQVQRFGALDSTYPRKFRQYLDSVLRSMRPGPEADEIRETVKIQAAGTVPGLELLPDIPIAVLTSMKSDESAPYVNGTARGHVVWRELHDEWFRRSRNGIHIQTTRSGHGIQDDEPSLVADAIKFVVDRVTLPPQGASK